MASVSSAFTQQKVALDFASLRHACPKGIYVAPLPPECLTWTGVLFVRKGPYANAILRFQFAFPDQYPHRPPVVTLQSDVFHPLVTPLTTYTYSTRDTGADTVSAVDEERLPPGGLTLRYGFPEWFDKDRDGRRDAKSDRETSTAVKEAAAGEPSNAAVKEFPHVLELLQYLRIVFESEEVLDSIPLQLVANAGAWHAWRSFRAKLSANLNHQSSGGSAMSTAVEAETTRNPSHSPRQQPGGARRPGEWNWQGVWEDRVRKSIQGSISHPILFGNDDDVINFLRMDEAALDSISPLKPTNI